MTQQKRLIGTSQRGLTLVSLIFLLATLGAIAVLALKVSPTVIEYFSIKKAVTAAKANGNTVRDIQSAFDLQTNVGYIESISGKDLDIVKTESGFDVGFAYPKRIELGGPVSLLIEYEWSTAKTKKFAPKID